MQARWMGNAPGAVRGMLPWVSLDREAVLAYTDKQQQRRALESINLRQANEAVNRVADELGWASPSVRMDSSELDQIALSNDGREIILIELKPRNGAKAYYSPLQLLRYAGEWIQALSGPDKGNIINDLNSLVEAKNEVDLMRDQARLSETPMIRPVIGFNDPPTAEVLARMRIVWQIASSCLPTASPAAVGPEVWAWPDRGTPYKLANLAP